MTTARFEAVLARLYVDDAFRRRFLADPAGEAARAGLDPDEARALAAVDAVDREMASRTFAHKRARAPRRLGWLALLLGR